MNMLRTVAVSLLGSSMLTACERTEVNGIGSYTGDPAQPPQLDVVGSDRCAAGEWGFALADATIRNNTADVATYEVVIAFESDAVRLGQGSAWVRSLDPGQTSELTVTRHLGEAAAELTTCRVITVNRWEADTTSPG